MGSAATNIRMSNAELNIQKDIYSKGRALYVDGGRSLSGGTWYSDYMKVLFICRANIGRSQAAMELYRLRGGQADSAGTRVDVPGQSLNDRPGAATIVNVMRNEYAVDMSRNVRTQLTLDLAANYDRLIVMAEHETIPKWLLTMPTAEFWQVDDPKQQDEITTRDIVREIACRIDALTV